MRLKHRWVRHPGWLVFFLVMFVLMPLQPNGQQASASDQTLLTNHIDEPIGLHAGYFGGQPQLFVTRGDCSSGGQLWGVDHSGAAQLLVTFDPRTGNPCTKLDVVALPTAPKVPTSTVAVQLGAETFVLAPPFPSTIPDVTQGGVATFTVGPDQCTSPNRTVTIDPLGARFTGLIVSCGDGTHFVAYDLSSGTPVLLVSLPNAANPQAVSVLGRPGILHPNWDGCGGCLGAYDDVQRRLLVIAGGSGGVPYVVLSSCIPTNSGRAWVFTTLRFFAFTDPALDPFNPNGQGVMSSIPTRDEIIAFKVSTFSAYAGYAIVGTYSGPIVAVSPFAGHSCTSVHASLGGNRYLEDGTPGPYRVVDVEVQQASADKNNKGVSGSGNLVAIIYSTNLFDPTSIDTSTITFGRYGTENSLIRCKAIPDANGDGKQELKCWFDSGVANCSDLVPCLLTGAAGDPDGLDGI